MPPIGRRISSSSSNSLSCEPSRSADFSARTFTHMEKSPAGELSSNLLMPGVCAAVVTSGFHGDTQRGEKQHQNYQHALEGWEIPMREECCQRQTVPNLLLNVGALIMQDLHFCIKSKSTVQNNYDCPVQHCALLQNISASSSSATNFLFFF